jgi:response regulator RpfG family c-di-GMP phosphodiesterase
MSNCILSVNGNKAMNYLLQTVLGSDHQFVPVTDVYHGMYQLRVNNKIQLLIVDVDFETEESWEMIQHIKTSKLYEVPVFVLTTTNDDNIKNKCYELGIDEIFFKPFNPVDLIAAVKSLKLAGLYSNA